MNTETQRNTTPMSITFIAVLLIVSTFLSKEVFQSESKIWAFYFALAAALFGSGILLRIRCSFRKGLILAAYTAAGAVLFSAAVLLFFKPELNDNTEWAARILVVFIRTLFLASFAAFGLGAGEYVRLKKEHTQLADENLRYQKESDRIKKEAELIIAEAKQKAQAVAAQAALQEKETMLRKERLEAEVKKLIYSEIEIIKQYNNGEK